MVSLTWIIIGVIIAAIWIIIEMKRMKHKLFAIFLIGLILFVYITAVFVFKDRNIDFGTFEGIKEASSLYFSWLGSTFGNLKIITGNVIKMNWAGNNSAIPGK